MTSSYPDPSLVRARRGQVRRRCAAFWRGAPCLLSMACAPLEDLSAYSSGAPELPAGGDAAAPSPSNVDVVQPGQDASGTALDTMTRDAGLAEPVPPPIAQGGGSGQDTTPPQIVATVPA